MSSEESIGDFEALDISRHSGLRIDRSARYRQFATVNNTSILAEEVPDMAASCPVVLLKDESSGRFQLSAIFGLEESENLFVDESGN